MRSPGDDIARVVSVHEAANRKGISQRLGATRWSLLLDITVEFLPIRTVVEELVFYVWLLGIEYQTESRESMRASPRTIWTQILRGLMEGNVLLLHSERVELHAKPHRLGCLPEEELS